MSAKQRIKKLEQAAETENAGTFFEYRHFLHTIDGDKHTYQMGRTGDIHEVDAETYKRELAEYEPIATAHGLPAEIQIIYGEETENG